MANFSRIWYREEMKDIVACRVILDRMIVEARDSNVLKRTKDVLYNNHYGEVVRLEQLLFTPVDM